MAVDDLISLGFCKKAPLGRFLRRLLNLNSGNNNQRDRRRRFYLAVLIGRISSVVFAIVVRSIHYSNPFWRSPQYAIAPMSRVLMRRAVFRAHRRTGLAALGQQ
jgi:hypothetical protein